MCSLFWELEYCSDHSSSSSETEEVVMAKSYPLPSPPPSRKPRRLAPMRGHPRPFDYRIVPEIEVSEDSYRVPPISGAERWEEFSEVEKNHLLILSCLSSEIRLLIATFYWAFLSHKCQ